MRRLATRLGGLVWGNDPASRLAAVAEPALSALADARVPLPSVEFGDPGGGLGAVFRPVPWRIVVRESPRYDAAQATRGEMQELGAQLVHEARHADQYYLAARLLWGLPGRNVQQQDLLRLTSKVSDSARARQIAAPSIFGKAKYRAAMAKVSAMVTDVPQADARTQAVAREAVALRTFIGELQTTLDTVKVTVFPDEQAREQQREWRLAKTVEGEGLRMAYRQALIDYSSAGVESDAFDIQMRAKGEEFDAAEEAERIANKRYAQVISLLTGLQEEEAPPAAQRAVPLQAVQLHAIPEEIAALD